MTRRKKKVVTTPAMGAATSTSYAGHLTIQRRTRAGIAEEDPGWGQSAQTPSWVPCKIIGDAVPVGGYLATVA